MPKFSKFILLVAGGVVVLAGIVLLVANLYLQSEGVQGRIRQAASVALGTHVEIRGAFYTPWSGLVLGDLAAADPEDPSRNMLEARALRLRLALLPLLSGRIVLSQVVLDRPTLIARQRSDRSWAVLVPPPPERKLAVAIPAAEADERPTARRRSIQVEVERIAVRDATIAFVDAQGRPVVNVEDASGEARIAPDRSSRGNLAIGRLTLGRSLHAEKVSSPFEWDGHTLQISRIHGDLAGGTLSGSYRLDAAENPGFQLDLSVSGAQVVRLLQDSGADSDGAAGVVEAGLSLRGEADQPGGVGGAARIDVVGGRFVPVDFVVQIGRLLAIEELQELELSEALARMTIADGKVLLDQAALRSKNLTLTGTGNIGFDGQLDIAAGLLVNQKLHKRIPGVFRKNFRDDADSGYKRLDFTVGNTLANPRTDLHEKLIDERVGQDIGNIFRQFLGPTAPKRPAPAD